MDRISRLLAVGIAALVLLVLPQQSWAATTWVLRGAGWGHGVGMSAWGAYGFGKHGRSYRQILGHYYTGTKIGSAPSRRVRVLLFAGAGSVTFSGSNGACGKALSPRASYRAVGRSGKVELLAGSRRLARCGSRLVASASSTISVGGRRYRGQVAVNAIGGSSFNVVNELDVESYIRGVMPGEVPPLWPTETLKAFAVAMRGIALTRDVGGNGFELYPDTRTQVYKGAAFEDPRTDRAVAATRGQVVTYAGKIAQTTYFASSGGRTESSFPGGVKLPYLKSVVDPFDYYAPRHRWEKRLSQSQIDALLRPYLRGSLVRVKVLERGDSPRIEKAQLVGTRGTTVVTGSTLKAALGLYERWVGFTKVTTRG